MTGKITWARPLGAWSIAMTVIILHAMSLPVPTWADVVAPLAVITWYVDRSLWKFFTGRKQGANL